MMEIATKSAVAIVCNSVPPYRHVAHRRVARELPEVKLWTLLTHEEDACWPGLDGSEIGLVKLPGGVSVREQGQRKHARAEFRTAGRAIDFVLRHNVRAVVLVGYNDLGRLRLLLWCRRHGIPCLIWGDSNIRDDELLRGRRKWIKRVIVSGILKFASGALVFGSPGRAYFQKYGVGADRIFPFPMEPDYDLIAAARSADLRAVVSPLGLLADRRRILFCGRLVAVKRADLLIAAFSAIAAERPEWDLVMLGDGPLRSELQARIPHALSPRVQWLGHVSNPATVAAVQSACDLLVLPSDREPWGMVINEALAASMAVVASSVVGAAVDLVVDGENGRIFARGDANDLKRCLMEATQPPTLEKFRAAGPAIMARWRRTHDPVRGLRDALRVLKVL